MTDVTRGSREPTAGNESPLDDLRRDLASLVRAFSDVPEAIKVLKIGEEFGEASEAYIGLYAFNPRKGKTHDFSDMVDELADVAVTALVALAEFSGDPVTALCERMAKAARRIEEARSVA